MHVENDNKAFLLLYTWKSIWKYLKKSNTLGKYLNTNLYFSFLKVKYKYFGKSI